MEMATDTEHIFGVGRKKLIHFLLTAATVGTAVAGLGWFAGPREAAHNALLSIMVFAFFPFLLMIAIIGILFTILIASLISGEAFTMIDSGGAPLENGMSIGQKYYAFLSRQKNAVFWGVPAGVLAGGLVLTILTFPLIIQKEHDTVARLTALQSQLSAYQLEHGVYPAPDSQGRLLLADLGLPEENGPFALDGFGKPLIYSATGAVAEKPPQELPTAAIDTSPEAAPTEEEPEGSMDAIKAKIKAGMARVGKKADQPDQPAEGGMSDKLKTGMAALGAKAKHLKTTMALGHYQIESTGFDIDNPKDDLIITGTTPLQEKWNEVKAVAGMAENGWSLAKAGYNAGKIISLYRQ